MIIIYLAGTVLAATLGIIIGVFILTRSETTIEEESYELKNQNNEKEKG